MHTIFRFLSSGLSSSLTFCLKRIPTLINNVPYIGLTLIPRRALSNYSLSIILKSFQKAVFFPFSRLEKKCQNYTREKSLTYKGYSLALNYIKAQITDRPWTHRSPEYIFSQRYMTPCCLFLLEWEILNFATSTPHEFFRRRLVSYLRTPKGRKGSPKFFAVVVHLKKKSRHRISWLPVCLIHPRFSRLRQKNCLSLREAQPLLCNFL